MQTMAPERAILVVEEEDEKRQSLVNVLQVDGHVVHQAADAWGALRVLGKHRVQLIVSNHQTPAMSAIYMLKAVRRRYPLVGQILLIDKASADAVAASIDEDEAFRILRKPCSSSGSRALSTSRSRIWGSMRRT